MEMKNQARARIATGDALDVRSFQVTQAMSRLFRVEVGFVSTNPDIDFDAVIGQPAEFSLSTAESSQSWSGICIDIDQIRVEADNLATYTLVIAPLAYLLTQRKNYRIFQYKSELDIVRQILGEWGVPHRAQVDGAGHPPRKFRAQYGESDYDFISRMLEDAGISFHFEGSDDGTTMVLDDGPQSREVGHPMLQFLDRPGVAETTFVTAVSIAQRTRPGKVTVGDVDYRRASTQQPRLSASGGLPQEGRLEQLDHEPGAFLYQGAGGGNTPAADDRGAARTDEKTGTLKTNNKLRGKRQDAMRVSLESNVLSLSPGSVLSVVGHPHASIAADAPLLVTSASIEGEHDDDWRVEVECVGTDAPFKPELVTARPKVKGLESATVVGPAADEIHTDEYGRVRVHFHWDRESKRDETSSCWLPVNQPWAGASFGGINLPRIGQEVLVEFLGGDPDRPVVVGRVYTENNKPAYPLPAGLKITGIIGKSTPAMVYGAAEMMSEGEFERMRIERAVPGPFKASPPKEVPTYVKDNAFLLGDAQGEDITFIQAKRDLNLLVKNSWTTVVGNYRGTFVGGDDMLKVRNKQRIDVTENMELRVIREQWIEVGKLREERIQNGENRLSCLSDVSVATEGTVEYKAAQFVIFESAEGVQFKVKDSSITITKTTIQIKSAKVDINPDS